MLSSIILSKKSVQIHAEIKTATHSVGPSGAVISTGTAEITTDVMDMETDQESTGDHNNSVNLDTSELRELEALEAKGEIDEESLDLKLLDKSQDDVSTNIIYNIQMPSKRLKDNKLIIITVAVIGRITNSNKGTMNRRKKRCNAMCTISTQETIKEL